MVLPTTLPIPTESIIATFNFTDLITKTGHATFFVLGDNSGTLSLTPIEIESDDEKVETVASTTGGGDILHNEFDIDVEFQQPQNLKGTLYVAASYSITSDGSGASSRLLIRIYHVDGASVETEIGTQQTTLAISRGTTGTTDTRQTCAFTIGLTHFKIGDKLRLNIEQRGDLVGGASTMTLFHEGRNRDTTGRTFRGEALPTHIKCIVPFRIQL